MNHLVDDLTKGISVPEHLQDVDAIIDALKIFHVARENTYRMSFAKRGEAGVWMNLARKYDRIDNLARDIFNGVGVNPGVGLIDTLVDLALYSLKWLAIVKQLRPEDLEMWIERAYCHDTNISVESAKVYFGMMDELVESDDKHQKALELFESIGRMGND